MDGWKFACRLECNHYVIVKINMSYYDYDLEKIEEYHRCRCHECGNHAEKGRSHED